MRNFLCRGLIGILNCALCICILDWKDVHYYLVNNLRMLSKWPLNCARGETRSIPKEFIGHKTSTMQWGIWTEWKLGMKHYSWNVLIRKTYQRLKEVEDIDIHRKNHTNSLIIGLFSAKFTMVWQISFVIVSIVTSTNSRWYFYLIWVFALH